MRRYRFNTGGAKRFFSLRLQVILFLLLCSGCSLLLFSLHLDQGKHRYQVGEVARETLVAADPILDSARTEALKKQAENTVLPVEYVEPVILIEVRKDLDRLFTALDQVRSDPEADPEQRAQRLAAQTLPGDIRLEPAEAEALAAAEAKTLTDLKQDLADLLSQSLSKGVTLDQLETERQALVETVGSLKEYREAVRSFGGRVSSSLLRPNRFIDEKVTALRREEARNAVEPVMIPKGAVIASGGIVLDETHIGHLREAGMLVQETRARTLQLMGAAVLILIAVMYLTVYFYAQGGLLREPRLIYMLGILMTGMLGVALLTTRVSSWLYPFGFFPMLVTLLLDYRSAAILNSFLCLLMGIFFGMEPAQLAVFWLSGFSASLSIRRAEQRSALFFAGLTGALVGILLVVGAGFASGDRLQDLLYHSSFVAVAGLISSVLLLGSMPVWELGFKVLTPITLLELSNPNHPLLKRLLMEAPGTYHHSILVGNLSESAAHAVGANALLARVGSFYHDIGKVQMPHYFVENQMGAFNPHETLPPEVSAKVIREHVENGLKLAAEYRLPQEIREIIEQHHGSSLIRYFYHKASQEAGAEALSPDKFSYTGKTPRTREAAIVMLADSVEAAVRSLPDIRSETVKTMISRIVEEKLTTGQLSLCPLTFADLSVISERFETILAGVYHERIQYPELQKQPREEADHGTDIR